MKTKIEKIITELSDLPSLPFVVHKLLRVVADRRSAARDLAQVISMDQALTAKVLKLVNSAFFGFSNKITTVSRSVVILGFHTIKTFALGISVFETANKVKNKSSELNIEELWKHSIAVAAGARVIARLTRYKLPEEAFVAGLLHDIGKIILHQYMRKDFSEAIKLSKEKEIPLIEAENKILQTNHEEVGSYLGERWKLPYPLRKAIDSHHKPPLIEKDFDQDVLRLICIVNVANSLCKMRYSGFSGDVHISHQDEAVLKWLNIREGDIERFFLEIDSELIRSEELIGILRESKPTEESAEKNGEASVITKPSILLIYKKDDTVLMPYLFIKSLGLECQKISYQEIDDELFTEQNFEAIITTQLNTTETLDIQEKLDKFKLSIPYFSVSLPLNAKKIMNELGISQDELTAIEMPKKTEKKCLLISSEEPLTSRINVALEKIGVETLILNNPEKTIINVKQFEPDIIIIDINISGINGLTLLKILDCYLKAEAETQNTKIIVITENKKQPKELSEVKIAGTIQESADNNTLTETLDNLIFS